MMLTEDKAESTTTVRMNRHIPGVTDPLALHVWCFSIQLMTEIPLML